MKRSSGIIVTGLSATLLTAGAVTGSGVLWPEEPTSTAAAAAVDSSDAASTPAETSAVDEGSASSDATTTPETTAPAAATYTGDAVSMRYGTFQAEITVEDGVMTEISWLQSGEADHHSQQINDYAMPVLEQAILDAQSVDVGYVSGASYTSDAVEEAVLSAMQAAGLA